jgi:PAS domain S-box-containing protein
MQLDLVDNETVAGDELNRLRLENELLRSRLARKTAYIREKTQQLLTVAEGSTLLPEELDDDTLLELDPIGILFNSLSRTIGNLQRINDQFREGEERWRTIFMSVYTGLMIIRCEDHVIVDLNPAAAAMIGRPREEIIGRTCHCFVCPAEEGCCPITDLQQEVDNSERVVLQHDGTRLPVLKSVTRVKLYGKDHLVEGLVDISARKRAEAELAADRELMAATLCSIGDAVITTDQEGRVALFNREAEELTGWPADEAVGKTIGELLDLRNGEQRLTLARALARFGTPLQEERKQFLRLVRRDGTHRTVAGSSMTVASGECSPGTVLVLRDVTTQQQLEGDLLKARKLESVGLLAGGIAHDFNNLLTGIMANISMARQEIGADSPAKGRLKAAEDTSRRAHDLIQQLLSFSRKGRPVRKPSSVANLLVDAVPYVETGPHVTCRFDIPADLWYAEMDTVQIGQVIQNLVLNAAQAMPDGGEVVVSARNLSLDEPTLPSLKGGRYVRISISDGGVGIPHEEQERIFDPYFSTKENGTGLGLAIAYSIVRKHEGTITVESEPGAGTIFHVLLPATEGPALAERKESTATLPEQRGRILVMDDEPVVCEVVRSILGHAGYEVRMAASGEEAVEIFRKDHAGGIPFSAVILDLTVPGGMGGRETLQRLRAIDPQVRAMVSSGNALDPVMTDPGSYGFAGVILKPYRVADLKGALAQLLSPPPPAV